MNALEMLAAALPDYTQQVASDLAKDYAFTAFKIEVSSNVDDFRFTVFCTDGIGQFRCAWGHNIETALEDLKKQLPARSQLNAAKRAEAARLLAEAAQAEQIQPTTPDDTTRTAD